MFPVSQPSCLVYRVVQQRREVMDNLMFKGTFGIVCSRSAAASSYLPTLRTICRLEQLKEQDKVKRRYKHTQSIILFTS